MTETSFNDRLIQLAISYHKEVEGEYGCNGITCPGVQRLVVLLREATLSGGEIVCPDCGETVKQVASATLSLALWQHRNWKCAAASREQPSEPPPADLLKRLDAHMR